MNEALSNILVGAGGGLAGGVFVTVAVRIWDRYWKQRERRGQIAHIASVLFKYRTLIYDVPPDPPPKGPVSYAKSHDDRLDHYYELYHHLERVLARRTSELTFDQIDQIDGLFVRGFRERKRNPDPKWYVEKFDQAASIEWLKLRPPKVDHNIFRAIESEPA